MARNADVARNANVARNADVARIIKRDEQLKRNYFGSINILLVHTVTFVGHWGCEQHHRNCTNTARDAGGVDSITRSAQMQLSCVSTGMSITFLMHAYVMLHRRIFAFS